MTAQKPTPRKRTSMACPNCGKLVSINSEKCIHCGFARPGQFTGTPILSELLSGQVSFSQGIILVCFLLYAAAIALTGIALVNEPGTELNWLSILSPNSQALYQLGMGGRVPWEIGRWWTLLTATYLHGSLLHLAFNMLWLRRIGPLVESLFGNSRFLLLYTTGGLAGAALSTFLGTPFFIGASGAVFGLFGALIYYGWARGGTFGSTIFREMMLWAGINFVFGLVVANVDNWGHLGGLLGGAALAWVVGYLEKNKESVWHHRFAVVTLGLILICFGMMVFTYFSRG